MRTLLLMRGSAGCGKSTYIEENGLKPYTLSADDLRLLYQSPILNSNGNYSISQNNDTLVWKTLFQMLETRMKCGEFTVIDATNSKTSEMSRYKEMASTYRYRIYCIDFTDIPIDIVKERNNNRDILKRVPEEVIDKMYSRFATQKIPSGITILKPDELNKIWYTPIDLSNYKKIHHIGDIHGCYSALKEYLNNNGGIKDDECYIFSGDYIDRGKENVDVLLFLISIMDKSNVFLLEGNHERNLFLYGNDCSSTSKEFTLATKKQLNRDERISKKDIRCLYRKFIQCCYYNYNNNTILVTHGGLSCLPNNLTKVSTEQMIRGVGAYNDFELVADSFYSNTPDNFIQIFGHRNTKNVDIKMNDKCYNLEGKIEFGGNLRCVQISKNNIECIETKNNIYNEIKECEEKEEINELNINDLIINMRKNKYIQEKRYENISSFNFTRNAFEDKIWNELTTKARGLYIDINKNKIVARSYDKFFNINEKSETKFDTLQYKLKFPVDVFVKENGFLGIIGYNNDKDELFITTKSDPNGDHTIWFKELLYKIYSEETLNKIKDIIKEENVSFIFECVDMINDPHIIEYRESTIILLDIIKNDISYSKYNYDKLVNIAKELGLKVKEKAYRINNWQDFFDWYYDVLDKDYEYNGNKIEGFVIEDSNKYMIKLKLTYYNFWKFMRSISHEVIRKGYTSKTSALTTPLANNYYGWIKSIQYNLTNCKEMPKDICTLRKMYYQNLKNEEK